MNDVSFDVIGELEDRVGGASTVELGQEGEKTGENLGEGVVNGDNG